IVADVAEREMTVLVSSHNLRELEGLIDSVGILIGGQMRVEKSNLDELESEGGLLSLEELFFEEMEVAANE
ncbi:MAG: ABC transporter ATP-binding protein, partial [Firmicutes bacterium]|nr:ABC transporter ATP-binding protein [Bacillota bacterium]